MNKSKVGQKLMRKGAVIFGLFVFLITSALASEAEIVECSKKFLGTYYYSKGIFKKYPSPTCKTCFIHVAIGVPPSFNPERCYKETVASTSREFPVGRHSSKASHVQVQCKGNILSIVSTYKYDNIIDPNDPLDKGYAFLSKLITDDRYTLSENEMVFVEDVIRVYDIEAYLKFNPNFNKFKIPPKAKLLGDGKLLFERETIDEYKIVKNRQEEEALVEQFRKKHCPKHTDLNLEIEFHDMKKDQDIPQPKFVYKPICKLKKGIFPKLIQGFQDHHIQKCQEVSTGEKRSELCIMDFNQVTDLLTKFEKVQEVHCK